MRARSVTSRPKATGRATPWSQRQLPASRPASPPAPRGPRRRSTPAWAPCSGRAVGTDHHQQAPQQPWQVRLPLQREGHVGERAERHQGQLAGSMRGRHSTMSLAASRVAWPARGSRQLGVADTRGPCVSAAVRRGRAIGRAAPAGTSTSPRPASSSTASVLRTTSASSTLPATQLTPDDLGLWRCCRVEQREGVVDAGIAVDQQRDPWRRGHRMRSLVASQQARRPTDTSVSPRDSYESARGRAVASSAGKGSNRPISTARSTASPRDDVCSLP